MDQLTERIKEEIVKQYKNLSNFSRAAGIPNSTLVSALKNGVSSTAHSTVLKICSTLGISDGYELNDMAEKFAALDEESKKKIEEMMDAELMRSKGEVKKFSGAYQDDEHLKMLIREVLAET